MKLEITKERILEAASKCSTAKETLKTLFPEVFEEDKYLDLTNEKIGNLVQVRNDGVYANRSFFLSTRFDWEIKSDDQCLVLIPTKK